MNEVALHRGSSPHLNTIDAYVDGQHLTEAVVSIIPKFASFCKILIPFPVGWFDCFNTNRFDGLLSFCRWPNRPSITERSRPDTYLSPKPIFPPARLSSVFFYYPSSMSFPNVPSCVVFLSHLSNSQLLADR